MIYLESKSCLIVSNSTEHRDMLIDVVARLGFHKSKVSKVDTFDDAVSTIKQDKCNFLITEYEIANKCGLDLLELHLKEVPDRLDGGFCLILPRDIGDESEDKNKNKNKGKDKDKEEKERENLESLRFKMVSTESLDLALEGDFTFDTVVEDLKAMFEKKADPNQETIAMEKAKECMYRKDFDQGLELFDKAKVSEVNIAYASYYQGMIYKELENASNAKECFEECYLSNSKHYNCLSQLLDIYIEEKNPQRAFEMCKGIYDHHPVQDHQVPIFTRLIIATNNFDEMGILADVVGDRNSESSLEVNKTLAAGLAISGKMLYDRGKPEVSIEQLIKGVTFAGADTAILKNIFVALIATGKDHQEIMEIFDSINNDIRKRREFSVFELEIIDKCAAAGEIVQYGSSLLRKGITSFKIYDIMIKRYIELKSKRDVIEDMCREAVKKNPSMEDRFMGYLKEID